MNLRLCAALGPYDHVRDLRAQGIELLLLELSIEEIFFRFTKFREWQLSEMSFGKVISLMAEERPEIIALPVFMLGLACAMMGQEWALKVVAFSALVLSLIHI